MVCLLVVVLSGASGAFLSYCKAGANLGFRAVVLASAPHSKRSTDRHETDWRAHGDLREHPGNPGEHPLIKLGRFHSGPATLAAKVESFNPGGSVKDRIGIAMIEAAEKAGLLKPGGTIVEPTSGNTGVGLALVANLRGYRLICTCAEKIPKEKIALLEAMGADVVIPCPTDVEADDPRSYYKVAERIRDEEGRLPPLPVLQPGQPRGPLPHHRPEIWRQTDGKVTHWVVGVGTGGTISGTAKFLKEQNPAVHVVGVDTVGSVYAYYHEHRELPPAEQIHQYLIDGIGEDFMPSTVWWDYIDEIVTIDDKTAYRATMELARRESIFTGSSGGAAVGRRPPGRRAAGRGRAGGHAASPTPASAISRSSTRSGWPPRGCWRIERRGRRAFRMAPMRASSLSTAALSCRSLLAGCASSQSSVQSTAPELPPQRRLPPPRLRRRSITPPWCGRRRRPT